MLKHSKYVTSFPPIWDVYTTSPKSYRRIIDVETTSCVYSEVIEKAQIKTFDLLIVFWSLILSFLGCLEQRQHTRATLGHSVHKIWHNIGFLRSVFSRIRTESLILSLYGKKRVIEYSYFSIFYAVIVYLYK